ncbi:MAG: GNAT family N-acetyltransferase [Peptococcaceae bacterium]|nr:GNAT family N-acetyltransferase [Peptococcaceae bacterium]
MDQQTIRRHIEEGGTFYLDILGKSEHMETEQLPHYTIIRPKKGQHGGTSIYNIQIEQLPETEALRIVQEIKNYKEHIFWGMYPSEQLLQYIGEGEPRPEPLPEPNEEEAGMALLAAEKPDYPAIAKNITINKVSNAEDFQLWALLNNFVIHQGYPIIHPEHHYPVCQEGILSCFNVYDQGILAGVSSLLNHNGIFSLEFVAVSGAFRRRGVATAAIIAAVEDAIAQGAELITVRAIGTIKYLLPKLGFRIY